MANGLPYFKFIVSEWNDGDIQLCSWEAQGIFINVCAHYWSNEGELFMSKIKRLKKFSGISEKYWKELIEEECLKIDNDKISISFLDELLDERNKKASINAKNGQKGGRPKTENNPVGLNEESELKVNESNIEEKREEDIRGEEMREEETRALFGERNFEWFKKQIDEIWVDQLPSDKKQKIAAAIENAWAFLSTDFHRLNVIDSSGCKKLVNNAFGFLKNGSNQKHGNGRLEANLKALKNA